MNDFDFDVMQKKRTARGARHMKRGSKSRRCSLPTDNMTAAQIRARSGPCMSFKLNMPMDWKTFKTMPADLQQSYLDGLSSRFGVSTGTISKELFRMSAYGLGQYIRRNGLKLPGGGKLSNDKRVIWEEWLSGGPVEEAEPTPPPQEVSMKEIAPFTPEPGPMDMSRIVTLHNPEEQLLEVSDLAATFTGKFDAEKFMKWVAMLPVPDAKVRIRVEVTRV